MENTIASLRPMRLGEILDQAIRLYRRNFVAFVGIIALVYIPIMLIQTGLSYLTTHSINPYSSDPSQVFTPSYLLGIMGSFAMVFVDFVLVRGVATAALTRAVADNYLGQPIGILDAYKKISSSWMRLLGTLLLAMLGIFILSMAATIIPCVGWVIGPGAIVFLLFTVYPMLAPIIMIEKLDVTASLRRAWDLARRRFWWMLGFMFILALFAQLVITGPTLVVTYILGLLYAQPNSFQPTLLSTIISAVVSLIGALLYLPLQLTAYTLVYFDLRVRTEGFDLALLSMQASGEQPSMDAIIEMPAQSPSGKLLEWTDVGNFAILTFGAGGLFCLFYSIIVIIMAGIIGAMQG